MFIAMPRERNDAEPAEIMEAKKAEMLMTIPRERNDGKPVKIMEAKKAEMTNSYMILLH